MAEKDLLFKDQRIIIFVNDCFWYRHRCCQDKSENSKAPAFWTARAESISRCNKATFKRLTLNGWTVIIMWDCQKEKETTVRIHHRHYLLEYLQTIHKEITRLILLTK